MRHAVHLRILSVFIKLSLLLILVLISEKNVAYGAEVELGEDTLGIDFSEIQSVVDDVLGQDNGIHFSQYVKEIAAGEKQISGKGMVQDVLQMINENYRLEMKNVLVVIGIGVMGALFWNFSNVFQNNQVGETGFYITYLLLFSMVVVGFTQMAQVVELVLNHVLQFMKVLLPVYLLAIGFCSGAKTSLVFYESTFFLITVVQVLFLKIVLPLIQVYLVVSLADNLVKEDFLSKFADLLKTVISWIQKTLLGIVIGVHTIQGLLVPVIDQVKNSILLKGSSAIPGIGGAVSAVTETVFGAGVLVKNAIGVAGFIILILICVAPMIRLVIYTLLYKGGAAILQPISDKRVIGCMGTAAESGKMLLSTAFNGAILFIITIAMFAVSTNLRLHG